mmetsp:Transcript_72710/g.207117  ORF Transcript_72710/g.207117 Transcript_72710/m.207117 type:complete len:401 (-) Transcript_72710:263-1465(-)
MPYPADYFHGRVRTFDIQDHSPPSMPIIFEFLNDAKQFTNGSPLNTIAIHCKAGKGRTGTCCAAWLLFSKKASCAAEALELFAERRTDHIKTKKSKKKMIAVDTWGQVQQVHNLDRWLQVQQIYADHATLDAVPPPEVPTAINKITLSNLFKDVEAVRYVDVEVLSPAWSQGPGTVVATAETQLKWDGKTILKLDCEVRGDFRINIYSRDDKGKGKKPKKGKKAKRKKAGKEPGLLFYIFRHTSFLDPSGELQMAKHELGDTKMMKKLEFNEEGMIELSYEQHFDQIKPEEKQLIDQMHIHEHIEEMQNTADELRDKLAASEAETEAAGGMLSPKKSFANLRDAVPRRKSALDFLSTSMRGGKKHSLAQGDHSAKFKAELEANDDKIMNDLERSSSGPNL